MDAELVKHFIKELQNGNVDLVIACLESYLTGGAVACNKETKVIEGGKKVRNPAFNKLLEDMLKIHDAKNEDYSGALSLYQNFMETADIGVEPWKGIVVRMTDKFCRLKGFAKRGSLEVKDESIEDTLIDMANYSLLCILVRRECMEHKKA